MRCRILGEIFEASLYRNLRSIILDKHASVARSAQNPVLLITTRGSNEIGRYKCDRHSPQQQGPLQQLKMHDSSINMSALVAFWVTALLYGECMIFAASPLCLFLRLAGMKYVRLFHWMAHFLISPECNSLCMRHPSTVLSRCHWL